MPKGRPKGIALTPEQKAAAAAKRALKNKGEIFTKFIEIKELINKQVNTLSDDDVVLLESEINALLPAIKAAKQKALEAKKAALEAELAAINAKLN